MIESVCRCPPETFWTLLHDKGHWEFEIFLMLLFDGLVGAILWPWIAPFVKRHWKHHIDRDKREDADKSRWLHLKKMDQEEELSPEDGAELTELSKVHDPYYLYT